MKNLIALTSVLFISLTSSAQFTNTTGQPTGAPASEVIHDDSKGFVVFVTGDTLRGTIDFMEFGDRIVYVSATKKNELDRSKPLTIENVDTLTSMFIEGRGFFRPMDLFKSGKKKLAFISEENDSFTEYKFFQSGSGVLGYKIEGGNVKGTYDVFITVSNNEIIYKDKDIKDLKTTIDVYLKYCPEVINKVKNEEKGYKQNMLNPPYLLLKKVLIEANKICGKQ